jgi:hypothetical protein
MKKLIYGLLVFFLFACKKTEVIVTPPVVIVPEEAIKFSTNLDTGIYNFVDTIQLAITVSSKAPVSGFQYSVTTTWTDSSKQIYKLDSSTNSTSLILNIPGHKRMGNYSVQVTVTSKSTASNSSTKSISLVNIPILPAVNRDLFPDINWNDHVAGKNTFYDINQDGIPDIISYRRVSEKSPLPSIFEVNDYLGNKIYSFNLKNFKPSVRDSLLHIIIAYSDLNNDGLIDFGLSYMGEWWTGQPGAPGTTVRFIGNYICLLLSKGNLQYTPVEVLDAPNKRLAFNLTIFDWDLDGKDDVLLSDLENGDYLKNLGNNKFERGTLPKPSFFKQRIDNQLDFDGDGKIDMINLYINELDEQNRYTSSDMSQTLSVLSKSGVKHYPVVGKTIKKYIYLLGGLESAERINMVDGDGDGDLDLIVGTGISKGGPQIHGLDYIQDYYENTGSQFEFRPNYIEIDNALIGELQVWTYDIDKDGDLDLFYPTYRKTTLSNPKGSPFWWENTKKGFKINKKFRLKY